VAAAENAFEVVEATLPEGFHDAEILRVCIDYPRQVAIIELDVWLGPSVAKDGQTKNKYRRAEMRFPGLQFFVSDPPDENYPFDEARPITIDLEPDGAGTPALPQRDPNAFVCSFFVQEWNSCLRLSATGCEFEWISDEPEGG
jgi:hypothetical protein